MIKCDFLPDFLRDSACSLLLLTIFFLLQADTARLHITLIEALLAHVYVVMSGKHTRSI